ncbi:flavodoxin domain-containing protein [Lacunimicrobium album]
MLGTRTTQVMNVLAGLILAGIGFVFFRWTEGDWWVAFPSGSRLMLAAGVVVAYLVFCFWTYGTTLQAKAAIRDSLTPAVTSPDAILIAYASQTGIGEALARQTMKLLQSCGQVADVWSIETLTHQAMLSCRRVLFVASTTGDGDPPDHALPFARQTMLLSADLNGLTYGVLALGDRRYEQFCEFGRQIDQWLRSQNATPLFDTIEVDNVDQSSLDQWQAQLQRLASTDHRPVERITIPEMPYCRWALKERVEHNPGSMGGKAFFLSFSPIDSEPIEWIAGDIAEIVPRNSPARVHEILKQARLEPDDVVTVGPRTMSWRELLMSSQLPELNALPGVMYPEFAESLRPLRSRQYSIASIPEDGEIHLLVRRVDLGGGRLGIASGWLCDVAPADHVFEIRIRSNPTFHPCEPGVPMILIGNGTGIAGLRSHLKAREKCELSRNWLIFGERQRDCDFFFRDDIERWQASGLLARTDLAFSRDQTDRKYVQHLMQESAEELRAWVNDGAVIYVCGSLVGMAPEVDSVLRQVLGDSQVDQMRANGRYRRDVY